MDRPGSHPGARKGPSAVCLYFTKDSFRCHSALRDRALGFAGRKVRYYRGFFHRTHCAFLIFGFPSHSMCSARTLFLLLRVPHLFFTSEWHLFQRSLNCGFSSSVLIGKDCVALKIDNKPVYEISHHLLHYITTGKIHMHDFKYLHSI